LLVEGAVLNVKLSAINYQPTTINCFEHPLLPDPSSTQYPDDGNAANRHIHNFPWPPIVRSFFS
jgi:hypothetical protein